MGILRAHLCRGRSSRGYALGVNPFTTFRILLMPMRFLMKICIPSTKSLLHHRKQFSKRHGVQFLGSYRLRFTGCFVMTFPLTSSMFQTVNVRPILMAFWQCHQTRPITPRLSSH